MEKLKKNLSSNAVALLLISLMLLSSLTFLSSNIAYGQGNITFTSGVTMGFTSTQTMTFQPETMSFKFGTGIRMQFQEVIPDGMLMGCDLILVSWPPGYMPPMCSWWEVFDPLTGKPLGEIHIDGPGGPGEFHVDMVLPGPIPIPLGMPIWAEMKIPEVKPCDTFEVHEPTHWWPSPCTWWMFIDPETQQRFDFHVDWTNESCEFHIDKIYPRPFIPVFPLYELDAYSVGQIDEIHNCNWFEVLDPQGFVPTPCSWWEILDPTGARTGFEFHVDSAVDGKFHIDIVTPDPIIIPWGPTGTITVREKIDGISECDWFKASDPTLTPETCSWWRITSPDIGDVEFHVDIANPDGTFHVDLVEPTTIPPTYEVTAERKIDDIVSCDWFKVIDPPGFLPELCSWWRIISPQQWAGVKFHVDDSDGIRFHVDEVDGELSPITPWPYTVTAEPYQPPQQPPSWYIKPPYPDYAQSGMPDFDERQDDWWWRSWAFPDAVAVWQHYDQIYDDWDIYYSIYTDPNMWWTLGTDYARPLILDWPGHGLMQYFPGDDLQPAISWYSSNYAIAVWQHQEEGPLGLEWNIYYSRFIPNIGWTTPTRISFLDGTNDYDPAIAFDTNGWAVAVWVHGNQPAATVIYYSVWNPAGGWVGPANLLCPAAWPGKAAMPEIDVDSKHKVVTIWTDTAGAAGTERIYFSWAPFNIPVPPFLGWSAPAIVPGCPQGMNWQKGISPDNLGNNLMDWGRPAPSAGQEPLYYAKFVPNVGWNPGATQIPAPTNGEHPDLAYDFNNNAIAVYTNWAQVGPTGQIYYLFWNGANWQPAGGSFAATANAVMDQWPALAFIKNNKGILVWNAYPEPFGPGRRSEIFYSVYTGPYTGAWTPATKIYEPKNPMLFLTGDDYYVDIASPTGSPTTPMSPPPEPSTPEDPDWSYCGPVAVANSIWWFDSKYERNNIPPPTPSDTFPLVQSYGFWDDHDPNNVQPFIQHLAWLMDTDGQRTKLCSYGTWVWDMQAGITQYLSWSGVNSLGDVNGDGIVDQTDVDIVNAAMGSTPGSPGWNLAADIYPETVTGPYTADNIIDQSDLDLVNNNFGKKGMFYEHTTDVYPDFYYIEEEVEKCQDVVLLLAFHQNGVRDGGHFVTVAGVNSTASQYQLLISNPIRDDFEAGGTPAGRSPILHVHGPEPPYTTHNNASLVSQDAWTVRYNAAGGYWYLEGYFSDPAWEARIEFAVITSPTEWVHDIAVKDVKPSRTVVGQEFTCNVNVTVTNEGDFPETFDLTLYAETMPPPEIINTTTVTDLLVGETRGIILTWNTSGFALGNYTISAYAEPVMGETATEDNRLPDGKVYVGIPGDFVGQGYPIYAPPDGKVDFNDQMCFVDAFFAKYGIPPPCPECVSWCDLTGQGYPPLSAPDGKVDFNDQMCFVDCFFAQYGIPPPW